MLSAKLTDRDGQLEELRSLLDDAHQASGRVALITGAVGSGKTLLLAHFTNEANAAGALLLDGAASQPERNVPFALLKRMFQTAPLAPQARADADELMQWASADPSRARYAHVIPQLATVLLAATGSRTLVVAADDIHHGDDASLHFILHLARGIRHERVLIVLTDTTRHWAKAFRYRSELAQQPHFQRIPLKLLSLADTREILADQLTPATAARLSAEFHDVTGGNPLLVNALVADYRTTAETEGTPLRVVRSETYGEALLDCLYRCGAECLAVAQAIAVLGSQTTTGRLCRLLESDTLDVESALRSLNLCGVAEGSGIRDSQALATIYDATPVVELMELHHKAARLLHEEGAPACEVAAHLLRLPHRPAPWSAAVLEEAAEQALASGDPELARRCLEAAMSAGTDERRQAAIRLRLAGLVWRTLPAAAEEHLDRLTADMKAGLVPPADVAVPVSQLVWSGQLERAAEITEHLSKADARTGSEAAGGLAGARSWLKMVSPGLRTRMTSPKAPSPAVPGAPALPAMPAQPRSGYADDPYAQAAEAVSASVSEGTPDKALFVLQRYSLSDSTIQPLVFALWALIFGDQLELAALWCKRLIGECAAMRAPSWQAVLMSVRAELELRRGNLSGADHLAGTALSRMSMRSWGLGVAFPIATRAQALTGMGRFDDARDLLARRVPDGLVDTLPGLQYRRARGLWNLATSRHQAALGEFLACGDLVRKWDMDRPGLVPWRTDAAEAWLCLGNPEAAHQLASAQLQRVTRCQPQLRGRTLRVLGSSAGDLASRMAALQQSVDILERSGSQLQLSLALAELGSVCQEAGDYGRARTLMRRAWHLAKSGGAEPVCRWLSHARPEGRSAEPGADADAAQSGDSVLTEAENRVAVLAAQGLTNREISAKLYITVSTVEQHLTRIYRKLCVKRRRDLPTKLADLTSVAAG
ncbi:AAA family ATPase [Streptomyces sp. ISL-94]|nr:AAA family ATPase [Streptomyces sp. ISL-94]